MLPGIANETVIRLRATATDNGYGDSGLDWTAPATLSIEGCSVQPLDGQEVLLDRDAVVSRWKLYAPLTADITSTDRIRHRGVDYEVDGSIQDWPDIFGMGYRQAILRKAVG